ncbi:hypothetical protein H3C70_01155 [Patescibacteria group bacterium]|nr:hypothetical protein [Patescibacteria group bacterium]
MFPTLSPSSLNDILLGGVRILFYLGFFLYIIFAIIALRQIELMRKTVITPFSGVVFLIGLAHLLLAIAAFAFAFLTLM